MSAEIIHGYMYAMDTEGFYKTRLSSLFIQRLLDKNIITQAGANHLQQKEAF